MTTDATSPTEKIQRPTALDNPNVAAETINKIHRELADDPTAFKQALLDLQKQSKNDNNPDNDLQIEFGEGGRVEAVSLHRTFRDHTIFELDRAQEQLALENFQKVDPSKYETTLQALLSNVDGSESLFEAIAAQPGMDNSHDSIDRQKLENFLLNKEGDHTFVRNLLKTWDSDEMRHLRGMENKNAGLIWTPEYVQSDKLSIERLCQITNLDRKNLFESYRKTTESQLDQELEAEYAQATEKSAAQKVAEFYESKPQPAEVAKFEAQMFDQARLGAGYLAQHPEILNQLTRQVPLVAGSNFTQSYFDREKIANFVPDSPEQVAIKQGLEASHAFLQEYGKRHSYDPTAPQGLDSLPVDSLVAALYYFNDSSIKSLQDLRLRNQQGRH